MITSDVVNPPSIALIVNDLTEKNNDPPSSSPTFVHHSPVSESISKARRSSEDKSTNPEEIPAATAHIFEYMVWSAVNLVVGGIIFGIPSITLAILTRKFKRQVNVKVSKILSTLTLTCNIIVTFVALVGLVYAITYYNNPT